VFAPHAPARVPGVCLDGEKTLFPPETRTPPTAVHFATTLFKPLTTKRTSHSPGLPASNDHSKPIGSGIPDAAPAAYF